MRRLAWLGPLALVACASCGGGARMSGPRNLLVVVLDTTRADHVSAWGHERETTPTLDALAASGVVARNTYAQSSLTPVSGASLLTGLYPPRHGVRGLLAVGGSQRLADDATTLAELLRATGRATAGFISAPPIGERYGLDRGFDHYSADLDKRARARIEQERIGNAFQRRGDRTVDAAVAWLDAHAADPFFCFVHLFDAHDASLVPPRAFLEEDLSFPLPDEFDEVLHLARLEDPGQKLELYDNEIRFTDVQLARLLDSLDATGVRDDTLVVVCADHGEGLGEHDFWTHGLLWEEHLLVPLVLAGPGLPAGHVLDARVRLVDVLPTLAELFDLGVAHRRLDGASFLPLIEGTAGEGEPREVYAEVHHAESDRLERDPEMYSVIEGRWKFVHRPSVGVDELYDLAADPDETADLFAEDHKLVPYFRARLASLGAVTGSGISLDGVSDEYRQMLEDLGYL